MVNDQSSGVTYNPNTKRRTSRHDYGTDEADPGKEFLVNCSELIPHLTPTKALQG